MQQCCCCHAAAAAAVCLLDRARPQGYVHGWRVMLKGDVCIATWDGVEVCGRPCVFVFVFVFADKYKYKYKIYL
jgi:hypothetical protein